MSTEKPSATAPILVGVTGVGENVAALRYAVAEATATGRPITLVHAAHDVFPAPPPSMLMDTISWEQIGESIIADVRGDLAPLLTDPEVQVRSDAHLGPPGAVLSDLSETAGLVVLQHRQLSALWRVFTGSTVVSVASNSHCPVVSVPSEWEAPAPHGRLVVGVHEDGTPHEVLATAFDHAANRGWAVHLVHSWRIDPSYDKFMTPPSDEWDAQMRSRMEEAARPFAQTHPDVPVKVEVRHQWAADALLDLAAEADLLVVGRHGPRRYLPHRLGSIARTLIKSAPCPVMVVPL
jgi:nucleotide-binding universal stress UspA family protein